MLLTFKQLHASLIILKHAMKNQEVHENICCAFCL